MSEEKLRRRFFYPKKLSPVQSCLRFYPRKFHPSFHGPHRGEKLTTAQKNSGSDAFPLERPIKGPEALFRSLFAIAFRTVCLTSTCFLFFKDSFFESDNPHIFCFRMWVIPFFSFCFIPGNRVSLIFTAKEMPYFPMRRSPEAVRDDALLHEVGELVTADFLARLWGSLC